MRKKLVTIAFLREKLPLTQFYNHLTRKKQFFKGCSRFKLHDLGLSLGMALRFYTTVAKGLKLKAGKFWGLIPTFVEVTGEKPFFTPSPILNKVNNVAGLRPQTLMQVFPCKFCKIFKNNFFTEYLCLMNRLTL